jgi:Rrf2 family protein
MITTRSEYGMRAMIELAEEGSQRQLSAGEIARRAQVPGKYLEQILANLKRAGLVATACRGQPRRSPLVTSSARSTAHRQ